MKAIRHLGLATGVLVLAACGGGSSDNSFGTGGRASLSIAADSNSVPANPQGFAPSPSSPHTVQVTVRFNRATGGAVADGTNVNLSSSNANVGVVSPVDEPTDTGSTASSPTAGGQARFWFTSRDRTGNVTLTASASDPNGGGTISASLQMSVVDDDGTGPNRIEISVNESELPANVLGLDPAPSSLFTTQVNVAVLGANGQPVGDGTAVTLGVDNISRAQVSPASAPLQMGATAVAETVAGTARFLLTSGATEGVVTLQASISEESGSVVSESVSVNIVQNTFDDARVRITGKSTMPTNPLGVPAFIGSPFLNELTIEYIGADGNPGQATEITFPDDNDYEGIVVAVAPVTRGFYTTLTGAGLVFGSRYGSGPVLMNAGRSTVFIMSESSPGPLTFTAMVRDLDTGERFSNSFVIEMIDGAADFLPAVVEMIVSPDPVYVQGSGGPTTKPVQVFVRDSGGNAVPDPQGDGASWNNVLLRLEAPDDSDARLTGTGSEGSVSGTEIRVQTVNGIANFSLNTGSEIGSHRIIATVDRADNNVDVGLVDPISAEVTVNVGDGRLFSLELVSPILNAIRVNQVTNDLDVDFEPDVDPDTGVFVPADPDGTYSLTVTAQGSDQAGNPALPGTVVNFGKIDAPLTQTEPRFFVFSGPDGNPEEGGTLFSVLDPPEGFRDSSTRVDDTVEAGDTVALFGKSVPGNREHEATRVVQSVIDNSTLRVTEPFNPNNQSGAIVDDGFVIPWVIGRSQVGVIDHSVTLNEQGRASVRMTYPISSLGRPVVLWTQGTRVESAGNKTVADVEAALFPGVAPLILTASPSVIQANSNAIVRLCLTDGLRSPVQGAFVRGSIIEGGANGTLDGQAMPTQTARATGSAGAGCLDTQVFVSGIPPEGEDSVIGFNVGQAFAEVTVVPPGAARLIVAPSLITDFSLGTFTRSVALTLLDGDNQPISGVTLVGECESDGGILEIETTPGVTDANGNTSARVLIGMSGCGDGSGSEFPRVGTCTFTTLSGSPEGVLVVQGIDVTTLGLSPPPNCPVDDDDDDDDD
jgi:hypothetical protein